MNVNQILKKCFTARLHRLIYGKEIRLRRNPIIYDTAFFVELF